MENKTKYFKAQINDCPKWWELRIRETLYVAGRLSDFMWEDYIED